MVWEAVWDYISGRVEPTAPLPAGLPTSAAAAGEQLRRGELEAARMGAGYALGRLARGGDGAALGELVQSLAAEPDEEVFCYCWWWCWCWWCCYCCWWWCSRSDHTTERIARVAADNCVGVLADCY